MKDGHAPVIDLDKSSSATAGRVVRSRGLFRRRASAMTACLIGLAAFILGGVAVSLLGSAVTKRSERPSLETVLAFVEQPLEIQEISRTTVKLSGRISVVNQDSGFLTVQSIRIQAPGLKVAVSKSTKPVAYGSAVDVDATVTLDCQVDVGNLEVSAQFEGLALDGEEVGRDRSIEVDLRPWEDTMRQACLQAKLRAKE